MRAREKPVVLLVDSDIGYFDLLNEAFAESGNFVYLTPTIKDVIEKVHHEERRKVVVLVKWPSAQAKTIFTYIETVAHRAISFALVEGEWLDALHQIWRIESRPYDVFQKKTLSLMEFVLLVNNTPIWKDKEELIVDPLTGLENEKGFFQTVVPELAALCDRRKRRGNSDRRRTHMGSVSVLVIDANKIKLINDNLGHARGDDAIRKIAQAIKSRVRPSHHMCRKSGDEFWVYLPGFNLAQARRRGKIILSAISALEFRDDEDRLWNLSAFYGAASSHVDLIDEGPETALRQLIDRADTKLVKLKARRNRREGKLPGER